MSKRKMAVTGSFYPSQEEKLLSQIESFNQLLNKQSLDIIPRAIIVPHAGYIYSGFTANIAYNLSQSMKKKRVIVIGPSHRVFLEGASLSLHDEYETPLGNIPMDRNYAKRLIDTFPFLSFVETAHQEHSTETQAPFVKHYYDEIELVEVVYGRIEENNLFELVNFFLKDENNFVIISTDLSHFYTQEQANMLDSICLQAIENKQLDTFDKGCEACGILGVKAIINGAIEMDFKVKLLHYCTSFDETRDASSVVGYVSAIIGE